jgi:hypothetical protein
MPLVPTVCTLSPDHGHGRRRVLPYQVDNTLPQDNLEMRAKAGRKVYKEASCVVFCPVRVQSGDLPDSNGSKTSTQ